MTWLYLPQACLTEQATHASSASRSAPAPVASTSGSPSPCPDIELWAMSNGKPTPQPLSWRGWKTRPWIKLLSGATLEPSMAALGVERFISSLPDILASPSLPRDLGEGRPTPATSGRKSPASPMRPRPNGSSAKMSKATSIWDCPKSSETFVEWATRQKRASFRRLKLVHPTYGAASSFWPTPTAVMGGNRTDIEFSEKGMRFRVAIDQSGNQVSLHMAARLWSQLVTLARLLGVEMKDLTNYRYSRPLHLSLRAGTRSLDGEWTFNPNFSDWLMGWPIGWSDPTRAVTGLSRWKQRMRGALCALPSAGDGITSLES